MENDLIERYIYAVTRRMKPKTREDVADELRGLIDDMLQERCGDTPPTQKDIRVVLTELGSPQELFEKYDESAGKALIGPPYYGTYVLVMKIVLASVALGMTIVCGIEHFMEPMAWYELVGLWFSMLWSSLLQGFAIVTLLFAFFNRRGVRLGTGYNLDDLPAVPRNRDEIKVSDCLVGIGFCVVFMTVFLAAADHLCVFRNNGETIAMFTYEGTAGSWYFIVPFALLGVLRETVKLLERQFSRKVLLTGLAVDGVSAVLAVAWLTRGNMMNPEFTAAVNTLFAGDPAFIIRVFSNFQIFLLGVILLALALDAAETAIRSKRA